MHGWMPLTYAAAPIPAAAVLSGAAVKAGVIGLIRFLPLSEAFPGWGEALAWAGFIVAALLGLSLAGLPLTGGSLAKLAVKDLFGGGAAGVASQLSAAATTALMLAFVMRLARSPEKPTRLRQGVWGHGRLWPSPDCFSPGSNSPPSAARPRR
jgi:formate hydrogenlyase subunit 3/multisubunit Na+/H+ antiporter MnhD subunit